VLARVAVRIRERAKAKKMPLRTLATRVGTSPSQLFGVLSGARNPTVVWLCRVAEVLECDPGDFFRKPRSKPGGG